MDRLSRGTLFIMMTLLVSARSTCQRAKVGAIITKNNRIISTGYNGAPTGLPHCTDLGCEGDNGCERCSHAEAGAIAFAAREGISLETSFLYCTHAPCYTCAKLIINAGISQVTYLHPYRDTRGAQLLRQARRPAFQFVGSEEEIALVHRMGEIMEEDQGPTMQQLSFE